MSIWDKIHKDFNALSEEQKVDQIARMLTRMRMDKEVVLAEHKKTNKLLDEKQLAILKVCGSMESVLLNLLGIDCGAEGNDFVIRNDKGKILVESAEKWR